MYMSRTRSASRSGKVEKDILPGVRHSIIHRCIKFEDFKWECKHVCRASAERRELVETERRTSSCPVLVTIQILGGSLFA